MRYGTIFRLLAWSGTKEKLIPAGKRRGDEVTTDFCRGRVGGGGGFRTGGGF